MLQLAIALVGARCIVFRLGIIGRFSEIPSEAILGIVYMARGKLLLAVHMHLLSQLTWNFYERRYYGWQNSIRRVTSLEGQLVNSRAPEKAIYLRIAIYILLSQWRTDYARVPRSCRAVHEQTQNQPSRGATEGPQTKTATKPSSSSTTTTTIVVMHCIAWPWTFEAKIQPNLHGWDKPEWALYANKTS